MKDAVTQAVSGLQTAIEAAAAAGVVDPLVDAAVVVAADALTDAEAELFAAEVICKGFQESSSYMDSSEYLALLSDYNPVHPSSYVSFTETDSLEMVSDASNNFLIRSKAGTTDPSVSLSTTMTLSTDLECDTLIVGGGGAGSTHRGGGGGAGTLGTLSNFVIPQGTYTVTLGHGGSLPSSGNGGTGGSGTPTIFTDSINELKAGGGGAAGTSSLPSTAGGSTGGGDYYFSKPALGLQAFNTSNGLTGFTGTVYWYRNAGGTAAGSGNTGSGGGGGGFTTAGHASVYNGGVGGHGHSYVFDGSTILMAAGGGGGSHNVQSINPVAYSPGGENGGAAPTVPSHMYGSGGGGGAQSLGLGAAGTDGALLFKVVAYKGADGNFIDFPTSDPVLVPS